MISYNLNRLRFRFLTEEESTLLKVFNIGGSIDSGDEMLLLYKALLSMAKQAEQMQLEFAAEIKIMCKKRFGEKVQNAAELWNW